MDICAITVNVKIFGTCTETYVCFVIDNMTIVKQVLAQNQYVVLTWVSSGVINLESIPCNGTVSFERHVQRIVSAEYNTG